MAGGQHARQGHSSLVLVSHTPDQGQGDAKGPGEVRFEDPLTHHGGGQQSMNGQFGVGGGERAPGTSGLVNGAGTTKVDAPEGWDEWVDAYKNGDFINDGLVYAPPTPPVSIAAILSDHEATPRLPLNPLTHQVDTPTSSPTSSQVSFAEADLDLPSPPLNQPQEIRSPSVTSINSSQHSSGSAPNSELHLYGNSNTNSMKSRLGAYDDPQDLLEFYKRNRYFPSPSGEFEEERLATVRKYGLDEPVRREAVERACRIAKNYFKTSTVLVTLVLEHEQVLNAEIGWSPVDPGPGDPLSRAPLASSLCRHSILKTDDPKSIFIVPDVTKDWRFKDSPFAVNAGGGLGSYTAANIHLPSAASKSADGRTVPATLPVGSLCLVDNRPRGSFGETDRIVLSDLADMIAAEFQHGYEQKRRNAELNQANFLNTFLNTTLIQPTFIESPVPTPVPSSQSTPTERPTPTPTPISIHTNTNHNNKSDASTGTASSGSISRPLPFQHAAQELRTLTLTDSTAVLDLRSFRAPGPVSPRHTPPEMFGDPHSNNGGRGNMRRRDSVFERTSISGMGSVGLLGWDGNVDWEGVVKEDSILGAVADFVASYYSTGMTEFNAAGFESPLNAVLPHVTSSTYIRPVFDVDGTPALLLILTSEKKRFQLDSADIQFVENVGAVMLSSMLRQRALEADRAKLAFVGSVSHELRTPLHGITSQIELIREFSSASQLMKLTPFLDTADVCLEALRDVLDDTLHLAKLDNTSPSEMKELQKRSMVKADLALIAEHIAKATWVRKKRVDLVTADSQAPSTPKPDQVKVILEVQEREAGWSAMLDVGGIKRVLLNLLGNALKFTSVGVVKLSIRELSHKSRTGLPLVSIVIEDTGRGMSEEFLRDGKLFTPFVQEDSFANGAGLGMSISQSIIQRIGGKLQVTSELGVGTKMTITLPIEFTPASPESTPSAKFSDQTPLAEYHPRTSTRVISDELATLFSPGPSHVLLTTPASERGLDFSQAVEAAQNSFGPKLGRIPSKRNKRAASEQQELVIEAAKLSLANVPEALGQSPPSFPDFPRTSLSQISPNTPRTIGQDTPFVFAEAPRRRSITPAVKVVIADDNPIARNILSKLLSGKGIAFRQAEDGIQAVEKYKEHAPGDHIISILDLQMPRATGLEASVMIRKYEEKHDLPRSRILILSGLNEQERNPNINPSDAGAHDNWVVKGGKSLRIILDEIEALQTELDNTQPAIQAKHRDSV